MKASRKKCELRHLTWQVSSKRLYNKAKKLLCKSLTDTATSKSVSSKAENESFLTSLLLKKRQALLSSTSSEDQVNKDNM